MPELPEAYVIARHLDADLRGAVVRKVELLRPDMLVQPEAGLVGDAPGRTVLEVTAHAKVVLVRLAGGRWLVFRLGMTGQLFCCPGRAATAAHTHLVVRFEGTEEQLRFRDVRRFGCIYYEAAGTVDELSFRQTTGADVLTMDRQRFVELLGRSRAPVKAFLLNQTRLAGLGNIYIDESLFAAGIHPAQPACSISRPRRETLYDEVVRILRQAIECGGSSISDHVRPDGTRGYFQRKHTVYGKAGKPCPRCGRAIKRMTVAGRSTHLCTRCQRR